MHFNKQVITLGSKASSRRFGLAAVSLAAALDCGSALAQGQSAAATSQAYAAGRILVMPRAGLPDAALAKILSENGGGKARRVGKSELHIVDLPPGMEKQMVDKLNRHPHFKFAELDRIMPPSLVANDPYFGSEWHLAKIGAPAAWDQSTGSGVTIAILDTGVDGSHPDLSGNMVAGWNAFDNNTNTADVYGHGTAVAGAAAAALNNGTGVTGVAGQARIMPVRISDLNGWASWSTVAQGLTWAADRGARVANISYGGVSASSAVQSAAQYMRNKGGLVVVAAGNNGVAESYAATATMITVSATNSADQLASWSSYGGFINVAAPGDGIWTTNRGGGYGSWWGTSFASPVTAGVVGLMMAANPSLVAATVEKLLFSTAADLGASGWDNQYGWGRIDAAGAVAAAKASTSTVDVTAPVAVIGAPLGSSTVSGLVPVNVTATDNTGVVRVDLKVNGTTVASDSSPPFAFSWDSTKVGNGMSKLVAVAVDAAGNLGISSTVDVNVANTVTVDTTAPVISMTNPPNGGYVAPKMTIGVTATDNSGTAGITLTLSIDGKVVASATGGSLNYTWNTRRVSIGSHTITVVARDAAGNSSNMAVQVTKN